MLWIGLLLSSVAGHSLTCSGSNATKDGLLPPVKVIFNSSNTQMAGLVCLLHQIGDVVGHFEAEDDPCVQLLTLPAEPWELHVLLLRADVSSPLCEPRVYGPLPSVLQARFALLDEEALGSQNIVSLQLNSRGGHLLFDLDLDNEQKVLPLALRNLLEIVEMSPRNTSRQRQKDVLPSFQIYQRVAELEANPAMTKQVEETRYQKKLAHSLPMSYVSAALTAPLIAYAFVVAYALLWDKKEAEMREAEATQKSQETTSSTETEPLLSGASSKNTTSSS